MIEVNCSEDGENNIKIEPPTGIAITTDQQIKMNSDDNASIDSKKEFNVSSGEEMNLSSGKKLLESAQTGLELSCSGSSIKMDGNIDLKAKLIQEN